MTAAVSYDSNKGALLVELPAREDYAALLDTTHNLVGQLHERTCAKLYVDARQIELELSISQTFHLVTAVVDTVPRGLRVAVAARPAHRLMVEFAQVAAAHRGVLLQIFDSPGEALGWLA